MRPEESRLIEKRQDREWEAWGELIDAFCEMLDISREEMNRDEKKYRRFFYLVDNWGQESTRLRIVQRDIGVFDAMTQDGRIFSNRGIKE